MVYRAIAGNENPSLQNLSVSQRRLSLGWVGEGVVVWVIWADAFNSSAEEGFLLAPSLAMFENSHLTESSPILRITRQSSLSTG